MIAVRPVAPDEHRSFARVNALAMGRSPEDAEPSATFEPARALAAVEGGRILGVTETVTLDVSVPGGARVPFAGVRGVGVLPTHRRRGVLTALMRAQLDDAHERGEPLAGLWTTAAAIYPRYGYGIATFGQRISVERPAPRVAPVEGVDVRFAETATDLLAARSVHERVRDAVPGMVNRTDAWWEEWEG
ncbi:MAG TPA: GNAT family N-acetyltransferase, partial [Acidimicrobiales bacterium]